MSNSSPSRLFWVTAALVGFATAVLAGPAPTSTSVLTVGARVRPVARVEVVSAPVSLLVTERSLSALTEDKSEQTRLVTQALDSLRQAIQLGYRNAARIERDPALEPLRADSDFQRLQADLKK